MGRFFVHSPSLSHYIPCHACSDIHKHATVCIVYGFIFVHKQIYKLHTHTHTIWTWSNICCYSPISFSTFASFLFGIKKNKTIASDPLFCVRLYFTLQQQCFFLALFSPIVLVIYLRFGYGSCSRSLLSENKKQNNNNKVEVGRIFFRRDFVVVFVLVEFFSLFCWILLFCYVRFAVAWTTFCAGHDNIIRCTMCVVYNACCMCVCIVCAWNRANDLRVIGLLLLLSLSICHATNTKRKEISKKRENIVLVLGFICSRCC